jgi:hypothetical protein
MLIKKADDLDWHQVLVRAQDSGSEQSLLLGLSLASELMGMGTSLPQEIVQRMALYPNLASLKADVAMGLFTRGSYSADDPEKEFPARMNKWLFYKRATNQLQCETWRWQYFKAIITLEKNAI